MPTYEYACRECGEHLEAVQAFTDDALTTCPKCGGELRKVFSAVGIVFKGSGFYKTDNRSTGSKSTAPALAESPATAPTGSGSDSGTSGDSAAATAKPSSTPATSTPSPSSTASPASTS